MCVVGSTVVLYDGVVILRMFGTKEKKCQHVVLLPFLQSAGHHINQQCWHPSRFVRVPINPQKIVLLVASLESLDVSIYVEASIVPKENTQILIKDTTDTWCLITKSHLPLWQVLLRYFMSDAWGSKMCQRGLIFIVLASCICSILNGSEILITYSGLISPCLHCIPMEKRD